MQGVSNEDDERERGRGEGRLGLPEKSATKYLLQLNSSMSKCLQYIGVPRVFLC